MAQATAIIALCERLQKQSRKARNPQIVADLRLATRYLRVLAALKIADEAAHEYNPTRKHELEQEATQLHIQVHDGH